MDSWLLWPLPRDVDFSSPKSLNVRKTLLQRKSRNPRAETSTWGFCSLPGAGLLVFHHHLFSRFIYLGLGTGLIKLNFSALLRFSPQNIFTVECMSIVYCRLWWFTNRTKVQHHNKRGRAKQLRSSLFCVICMCHEITLFRNYLSPIVFTVVLIAPIHTPLVSSIRTCFK